MSERTNVAQFLQREIDVFRENMHHFLLDSNFDRSILIVSVDSIDAMKKVVSEVAADSFLSIVGRVETVVRRYMKSEPVPTDIEIEIIELAADWLGQLTILYREDLPEPKALVAELLYAFDLIECSQGASLQAGSSIPRLAAVVNNDVDPFLDDPEFAVQDRKVSLLCDLFADDPGFGLEFDLLHRTVSFLATVKTIGDDPFKTDPFIGLGGI